MDIHFETYCITINFSSMICIMLHCGLMIIINKTICRTFSKILTMMAIDWEKCSSTKFSMFVTSYNAKLSERFVNMMIILHSIAVILCNTHILVKHVDDGNASNVSTRLFVLEMDLPFDANQRFVYESVIIIQFFHFLLCSNVVSVFNAFLINLVSSM